MVQISLKSAMNGLPVMGGVEYVIGVATMLPYQRIQ
jgi:hypothetical protein